MTNITIPSPASDSLNRIWRVILLLCFVSAVLFGACGVGLNALAAHLPDRLLPFPQSRIHLQNAASIALWHSGVILLLCFTLRFSRSILSSAKGKYSILAFLLPALGMTVGTWLFVIPVTCHALALTIKASPAPLGGSLLILSWLALLGLCPTLLSASVTSPKPEANKLHAQGDQET